MGINDSPGGLETSAPSYFSSGLVEAFPLYGWDGLLCLMAPLKPTVLICLFWLRLEVNKTSECSQILAVKEFSLKVYSVI